jgi:hypothetical protein
LEEKKEKPDKKTQNTTINKKYKYKYNTHRKKRKRKQNQFQTPFRYSKRSD